VFLLATPPGDGRCVRGDIAYLDGERITQGSLTTLRRIEGATGMHLGPETALVTALERRGVVAVALRAGIRIAEGEAFDQLEYMKVESLRPRRLQRALDVAGERAYVRWVVVPLITERALHDVHRADLRSAGQARARYLLGRALQLGGSLQAFAGEGIEYITFPLSVQQPEIHAPPALRLDYEREIETWIATGRVGRRPKKPQHPIEEIPGLGIGDRGYVADMVALAKTLEDGALHRRPILDDETWLVMRRLRYVHGVYQMEGLKISPPDFQMWMKPRYGELDKAICAAQPMEAARRVAPGHPLMEWMK
jgi:hypothetical protein